MINKDALLPFVTLIIAQITLLDLAKLRYKGIKLFAILAIELIVQLAIGVSLLCFVGLETYARWYFIVMVLPGLLTFWLITLRRDTRDVFTVLVAIFTNIAVSIPSMWITLEMKMGYFEYSLLRIFFFIITFIILHFVMRRHYLQLQEEMEKGWGVYCIIPICTCAFFYYKFWQYSMTGDFRATLLDCTLIVVIMTAAFLVFTYIFIQLHEKYLVQEQKRILDLQNKAQRLQFEQQQEAAEKTNRRWHDLRHSTQELIELLQAGNTQAALNYLIEQRGTDEVPSEKYCLHPTVNSILCLWSERSRKAGIQLEICTDVPEQLEIEPMELSAVFANAFENAYEACLRLSEDREKFIKVDALYNGRRLAIGFTNSCDDSVVFEEGKPVSSKKGGGIGTRSIIYTVKRFHGTSYFEAKEGIFTARFILNA